MRRLDQWAAVARTQRATVRPRFELAMLAIARAVTERLWGRELNGPRRDWAVDVALRYLPVVLTLRRNGQSGPILELGSGSQGGIVPYLGKAVIGVEPTATGRSIGTELAASGFALPFPDRAFRCSLAVDVLEHVEMALRRLTVSELVRVTARSLLIVAPCDEAAERQDRSLDAAFQRLQGYRFPFLAEHVALGLPRSAELFADIRAAADSFGRRIRIDHRPINNVGVRWLVMRLWMSPSPLGQYLYWRTLLALVPMLARLNRRPTYRQLFHVELD